MSLVRTVGIVARIARPNLATIGYLAVLQAYLDAANTHDDPKRQPNVMCVAGFIATDALWSEWEERWIPFLEENHLHRWHQTYFYAKQKEELHLDLRPKN